MFRRSRSLLLLHGTLLAAIGCSGSSQAGSAQTGSPQLTISPSSTVSFGSVSVGTTSTAQTLNLTNSGTGTLTLSGITMTGATSAFTQTPSSTCPAASAGLAPNALCTLVFTFNPQTTGALSATVTATDNTSGSPVSITLTGTGTMATVPAASLTPATLMFPATAAGVAASAQTLTLTNTGTAPLAVTLPATLGGTNAAAFSIQSTTCTASLAAGSFCTFAVGFAPTAASSSYSGTFTVTDNSGNVAGATQSATLTGTSTAAAPSTVNTYALYAFPESDNSVTPLYALVNGAQKSIDMTMYALEDTTFLGDLVTACQRGVKVRVILDQNDEKSGNTPAYNQLNAQSNCSAVWANKAFEATHEKSFIVDGTQVAIMSLNLQSQYYSTTRDFALIENDPTDIAAIEATFNADYAAGTPPSGVAGASDFSSYSPGAGDDLIWSPTTAQADMLSIISNAKKTLLIENEEMGAANIVSALETACKNGVTVHIAIVNQSSYASNFAALQAAGCGVNVYADTTNGFYVHAKAVVADFGLSTQSVYMGSINYSIASMTENRELGVYITDPASVQTLQTTMASDYQMGTPY